MQKLKIILQSNIIYVLLIIFIIIYIILFTKFITYNSKYNLNTNNLTGIVISQINDENKIQLQVKTKENIIVNYYIEDNNINYIGKKIYVTGTIREVYNNTIPNLFNYKEYLYNNKMYYTFTAEYIEIISDESNIFYTLKSKLIDYIESVNKSEYYKLFVLGDKSSLDSETYNIYQENGISHLLAISGLHINIFVIILEFILKRINLISKYIIIISFLILYTFLVNYLVSILRCVIYYILKLTNKHFYLNITNTKILLLTAFILLIYNPFYIYNIGFLYSFTISFFLFNIEYKNNYLVSLFKVSLLAFLASLPITIMLNYEINLSSIIFNIICVPMVSFIMFPLSLITLIFPFLNIIFSASINIFEFINTMFNKNLSLILTIPKLNYLIIFLYYIILYISIKIKYKIFLLNIIILFIPKLNLLINNNYYIYYLDVGQGDSILLISPHQEDVILIDTGGNINYEVSNNTIDFLKSKGISNIDILVLSHGDYDHVGEANNIIENIKVNNIIFNNNEMNELEKNVNINNINILQNIDTKYFKASNLNNNKETNENNTSIVYQLIMYNYSFLFTGDIDSEGMIKIVDEYNLKTNFLKISHHGSNNNTTKEILNKLNPSYSFISSGKNNIYNHPHPEVLNIINEQNIINYTTSKDGTIEVIISKKGYLINNYNP